MNTYVAGLVLAVGFAVGCGAAPDAEELESAEGVGSANEDIKESASGPFVRASNAEVWAVENQWADADTSNARKAGLAWSANSALTWEEKYTKWMESMERTPGSPRSLQQRADYQTMRFTTPEGRAFEGPVLECADVAIWLRVTFSAWYKLPFFMTGYSKGQPIYMGHFGVVNKAGTPIAGYAAFKTQYKDSEASWKAGTAWPSDAALAKKHVGADDDASGIKVAGAELPAGAGAGAYFDQLYLNKRVGHFLALLDVNFGSMHLADGTATYHTKSAAVRAGDVLVHRWQKNGIGHVLPIMSVTRTSETVLRATVASGSMPRRQPFWATVADSTSYFTDESAGGAGNNYESTPYASLGGGVKRWRQPVIAAGRWMANVPRTDLGNWIPDSSLAAISQRPEQYAALMKEQDPETAKASAIKKIGETRTLLLTKPASCSTRSAREDAFKALYDVMGSDFSKSKAAVDAEFRTLEDYVFGELVYPASKTCCWNTTTPAMASIVLDLAKKEQAEAAARNQCAEPTRFMNQKDGYAKWRTHAALIGRAAEWREWSEDEPCAQRAVAEDSLSEVGKLSFCARAVAGAP